MWHNKGRGHKRHGEKTERPKRRAQDDPENSEKAFAFVLVSFLNAMITDPDKRNYDKKNIYWFTVHSAVQDWKAAGN